MGQLAWVDASAGVSGDMLLGALADLGALAELPTLIASLADLGVDYDSEVTDRGGLRAVKVRIEAQPEQPARGLPEVLAIVERAAVPPAVRERAAAVFQRIAAVEAAAHGTTVEQVHFHEVGAVDAIVDVVAGCLGLHQLAVDEVVVSPIALGGGMVQAAHGTLPAPTPAALGLLAGTGLVAIGGPADRELATPTGVALLAEWATGSGAMPAMHVASVGVGAGSHDDRDRPNVTRIVVGTATAAPDAAGEQWLTISANVDDLDPRLWPGVLTRLLAAGAVDAWLTPIVMKKGRPAHTVSALVAASAAGAVRDALFAETTTIGVRETAVVKHALQRSWVTVVVGGQDVRVKVARDGGRVLTATPEFDDVVAAAAATGQPTKDVLAAASAAARQLLGEAGAG